MVLGEKHGTNYLPYTFRVNYLFFGLDFIT